MSRFDFGPSESSADVSNFLTKPQADTLYHNENNDIDLKDHKIINVKDGTDNSDGVNKKQLDDKVDFDLFAKLSTDVQWLEQNHVAPTDLDNKATKTELTALFNLVGTCISRVSAVEAKFEKLVTELGKNNTSKKQSKSGVLPVTTANDHVLFEVSTFTMISLPQFSFQSSGTPSEWHDLQHHAIRGVLGYAYIKVVDNIQKDKKQVILYTYHNDWMRKPLFSNYYTFNYLLEYVSIEPIQINLGTPLVNDNTNIPTS
jgi:hypothetical protein